jgi:L-lactate dehydrogenase (cytochrome)
MGLIDYVNGQFDRSVTWADAAWLAQEWGGPFVVKGILSVADALQAREIGASAIMISNHGGRQLDGVPAPIEMIEPIRAAVGPDVELIVDGGIRRGSDVVKALCLGAHSCSIGRPYLYGLAAAGQRGVTGVIDILKADIVRTMTLLGCADLPSLNRTAIARRCGAESVFHI